MLKKSVCGMGEVGYGGMQGVKLNKNTVKCLLQVICNPDKQNSSDIE